MYESVWDVQLQKDLKSYSKSEVRLWGTFPRDAILESAGAWPVSGGGVVEMDSTNGVAVRLSTRLNVNFLMAVRGTRLSSS